MYTIQHDPTGDLQQNLEPLDDEEIDERWSYLKHAENEMRRAGLSLARALARSLSLERERERRISFDVHAYIDPG